MDKPKKWTIVFLLRSVDINVNVAVKTINSLRMIDFGAEIQVVLCINTIESAITTLQTGAPIETEGPAADTITTVFYALCKISRPTPEGFINELTCLGKKDNFHIDDPADVKDFFKARVLDHFQADRYALFTWDHGNGFAIFTNNDPGDPADSKVKLIRQPDPPQPADKVLTMDELAAAIKWVFPDGKLDVLVMMNCDMQSFDAGYALRNSVDYLIAPEGNMDFGAYNYPFFFGELAKTPGLPTRTWATLIVDSVATTVYDVPTVGVSAKSHTAVFATDLSYYEKMAGNIDLIAESLDKMKLTHLPEMKKAAGMTHPFNSVVYLVDFSFLLENLARTLGQDWEAETRKSILGLKHDIVVAEFIGSTLMKADSGPSPSGFSVLFKIHEEGEVIGADTRKLWDLYKADSFANDGEWNKFVLRLAGFLPDPPKYK